MLTLAIPKGRIVKSLAPFFERAGVSTRELLSEDRKLIRGTPDGSLRFLLLKPDDVPTYVELGVAEGRQRGERISWEGLLPPGDYILELHAGDPTVEDTSVGSPRFASWKEFEVDKEGKVAPDYEDEILKAALVTQGGAIVHPNLTA